MKPARATEILKHFALRNLEQNPPKPYTRADVTVTCAKLLFDPHSLDATKRTSWTQAPKVRLLPDRFVVMAYRGGIEVKRVIVGQDRLVERLLPRPPMVVLAQQAGVHAQIGEASAGVGARRVDGEPARRLVAIVTARAGIPAVDVLVARRAAAWRRAAEVKQVVAGAARRRPMLPLG